MAVAILKSGKPAPLCAGERVLHEQQRFRAISSASFPSYRIGFNLPPLWRFELLVTDRRCLVRADFLHYLHQEIGIWYPGRNPADDSETLVGADCKSGLFGRCLELRSINPRRRGWQRLVWSPNLTLRFFLEQPETIERIIARQLSEKSAD